MKNHSPKKDAPVSYKIAGFDYIRYRLHSAVSGAVSAQNHKLVEWSLKDFVSYNKTVGPEAFEGWNVVGNDVCKQVLSKYSHLVEGRVE